MIKRIAITGPESTGKTKLAKQLAAYYNTIWVPEYARGYLERLNRAYTYDDILTIAKHQFIQNMESTPEAGKPVFCDTELIVTKIWCDVKYGQCHPWILENIPKQAFDLYLLTDTDIPWEADAQREHPNLRHHLKQLYLNELHSRNLPFKLISGEGNQRLAEAKSAVAEIL
jgi:NadR type nicotinamide-nucleotide adenylyltransferase